MESAYREASTCPGCGAALSYQDGTFTSAGDFVCKRCAAHQDVAKLPTTIGAKVPSGEHSLRHCPSCSAPTAAMHLIIHHSINRIPAGTSMKFYCATCGREFKLRSSYRTALIVMLGVILLLIGLGKLTARVSSEGDVLFALALMFGGIAALAICAIEAWTRSRSRPVRAR
jgi:hypothetical protein